MRALFTTDEALATGMSPAALRWGERKGRWRRIELPRNPCPSAEEAVKLLRHAAVWAGQLRVRVWRKGIRSEAADVEAGGDVGC